MLRTGVEVLRPQYDVLNLSYYFRCGDSVACVALGAPHAIGS